MMEIKTERELLSDCYFDGFRVTKGNLSTLDKKWIAVDDMINLLEDDSITCFEDLQDIILDLKGEK